MRALSVRNTRLFLVGIIVLTLLAVLFNYLQTWHRRARAVKTAPQILSSEMKRSASGIEHSEYRDGILHFKIKSRQLLESKTGQNMLDGFEAHDFNPDGSIRNEIRSRNAQYDPVRKVADFSGDVRLLIGMRIEVRSESLHYDLNSGIGTTPDALQFQSDEVRGSARGLRFDQKQQSLTLDSAVDLTLTQASKNEEAKPRTMHATSARAFSSELTNRILFEGHARVESDAQVLSGEKIEAVMDSNRKSVRSLTADGNATYEAETSGEKRLLAGEHLNFTMNAQGALEKIHASGQASFSSVSPSERQGLQGGDIDVAFDAKGLPVRINAAPDVSFETNRGNEHVTASGDKLDAAFKPGTRTLENIRIWAAVPAPANGNCSASRNRARMVTAGTTASEKSELQADFIQINLRQSAGRPALQNIHAEGEACYASRSAAKNEVVEPERELSAALVEMFQSEKGDFLEWGTATGKVKITEKSLDPAAQSQMKQLLADKAVFRFFPGSSQLKKLDAEGSVQVTYSRKGASGDKPGELRTTSDKMSSQFAPKPGNSIESVAQSGHFTYTDGPRSASSGRCDYDAVKDILVLRESPVINDEAKRTTGDVVEYDRTQKTMIVNGRVRSILFAQKGGSVFGPSSSSSPGIVTSESMRYWTETGRVRYTGKVKLLSENQQLQSDTLEIANNLQQVDAQGSVRHLMSRNASSPARGGKQKEAQSFDVTIVQSTAMTYRKETGQVSYSGKVTLHSKDADLSSDSLDAVPDPDGKEIKRATGRGNVTMHAGTREFKGDVADYYTEPQNYVVITGLPGKPAEAYEPGKGRSFARRLTYFAADDTIQLEK